MNNKIKSLFLCFLMVVLLPLSMVLTGCGATPKNNVLGVAFESMIYDEETGYAVFEVDKNLETPLEYKVFPSTCTGYKVYFDPVDKGTAENSARFTFENGKITVNSDTFEEVTYKVRIGDYTDTCIVRLKTYPISIRPEKSSMVIGAYEAASINVIATFMNPNGLTYTRNISESDFNFKVEPADETIIRVDNENRLKFRSIRSKAAETSVKVSLMDATGEKELLSFEIDVTITQNADTAYLLMEKGCNRIIRNDQMVEVVYDELETEGVYKAIKFDVYIVSGTNLWIEGDSNLTIQLSNKKLAKVSDDGKYILLTDSIVNGYELEVNICTDITREDGSLFIINLLIKFVR